MQRPSKLPSSHLRGTRVPFRGEVPAPSIYKASAKRLRTACRRDGKLAIRDRKPHGSTRPGYFICHSTCVDVALQQMPASLRDLLPAAGHFQLRTPYDRLARRARSTRRAGPPDPSRIANAAACLLNGTNRGELDVSPTGSREQPARRPPEQGCDRSGATQFRGLDLRERGCDGAARPPSREGCPDPQEASARPSLRARATNASTIVCAIGDRSISPSGFSQNQRIS